ncbi:MAG: SusC/RagA family TonB-linked outer membrane protein [Bacteroidota bacterium]|nr:SusC/RagA family TonB-linked outer membrane protein [Bacteroidota bacterium]
MVKIYISHSVTKWLLLIMGILIAESPILAQEGSVKIQKDTSFNAAEQQKEPGALFSVNKNTSSAAVSSVSGDVLFKTPVANISNTLYGLLPGLTVYQGSGQPGYDAASLKIRGTGSYNNESYAIYVDGFQADFNYFQYLSPGEIESISILKDAAALAPFGMKGANGVIWVTTKRGKIGLPKVQLQIRTGFQEPFNINKPLGSYDYARLYNEAVSNDNGRVWSPVFTTAQLQNYKTGAGTNVDWYKEVLNNNTPFTTTDASFSGGGTAAQYFVMLGYLNDQGFYNVKNDDTHSNATLQNYNIRTNLDFNMFKIFEGKVDIGGSVQDRRYPNYDGNTLWSNLARYPSNIYPAKNNNGTWTGTTTYPNNPLASINALGYTSTHDRTLLANFNLKEKLDFITSGLYVNEGASFNTWTRGSYNVTKDYARVIDDVTQTTNKNSNYSIWDDYGTNQMNWNQFQGMIGYDKTFGENNLSAAVNYLQYTYMVDANQNGAAGVNDVYGHENLGGKVHFVNRNRYTADLSFAYSGSDNYAKGNRWGLYPALAGAWIISNEPFMQGNQNIDFLKLRASVGKTGYDSFSNGRYLYQQYYTNSGGFPTGNGNPTWRSGLQQAYVPNPDIFAEQSMKYDMGVDAKLYKKLDVTLDAFIDKRSGIVTLDNSLMGLFGATPSYKNIGKVTSKGIEASLNYNNNIGEITYNISGMASYNSNKIDYMAEIPPVSPNAAQTGNQIGSTFGYQANGFYDITDFSSDGSLKAALPVPTFGAVEPGDIKYVDQNHDGKIDQADMIRVGKTYMPQFNYSFNISASYKGFDVRVLLQGVTGRTINLLDIANQTEAFVNNGNVYSIAEGRWAYYPSQNIDTRSTATYPRLTTLANNNNYINSTFWMKNGNFMRLRNVEIGYTLPVSLQKRLHLSNTRIYVNGINLLTLSPLLRNYHIDPETISGYPAVKSYNLGISVNF